jgi:prepilin-type N-terminal cleavage/methylation domain-containing protein
MKEEVSPGACGSVRRGERLTNCAGARRGQRRHNAFTLIELVLVVGVITVLSALVLSTVGYARKKGAMARAESEIAAMSAACENYKADYAVYPRDNPTPGYTDALDAQQNGDPTQNIYQNASLYLFTQLSGLNQNQTPIAGARSYFSFKPQMLLIATNGNVLAIKDPLGNSYGYSTAYQAWADSNYSGAQRGYNPTFDVWSTAGLTTAGQPTPVDRNRWIKNW